MTQSTEQKQQKMVNLFIKLSEVTGFISKKESASTQHRLRTTMGRGTGELQDLVSKHNIDPELARLLWQVVQKSPAVHQEFSQEGTDISFEELSPELQKQIILAEQLVKNKIVSLHEINKALAEFQQNPSSNIGQILLRKRVLTSEQFVEMNQQALRITQNNPKLVHLVIKLHGHKIYLNNSNIPKNIGDYEIIREIARGGMGVVYQAKDPDLDKIVALKTIIAGEAADEIDIERFRREAKLTSHLDHPNIVKIHEVGMQNNLHYYTMDYVEGVGLSEYVKKNKPSLRKLLKMFLQIADALSCAHNNKIIHRDIKPGNVLVDENGHPFLTDFGLARQQGGKDGLTISGVAIGTPAYMSPEQAEGRIREIDESSDLYSLGAVFYELLCGQPPFAGNSLAETLQMILTKEPIRLKQLVPSIPIKVETICLKCLKKNKKQRYTNAKALMRDIERFLKGDEIKAKRSVPMEILGKWFFEYKSVIYTTITVSLLFSIVLLFTFFALNKNKRLYFETLDSLDVANKELLEVKDSNRILTAKYDNAIIEKDILDEKLRNQKEAPAKDGVSVNPEELSILYNDAGVTQLELSKATERSIAFFDNAINLNPNLIVSYNNRGIAKTRLGRFREAIIDFDFIITQKARQASDLDLLKARESRARCYFELGDAEKALLDLNFCIGKNNREAVYYNHRALVYAKLGNKKAAVEDIEYAIKLLPAVDFYYNKGVIYFDFKDRENARKAFEICTNADPNFRAREIKEMLMKMGF